MPNTPTVLLCRYRYDPLDRLAGREEAGQVSGQCFYQKNRLTTEIQGQARRSWLHTPQQLLAQQRCTASVSETVLIATDAQGSVLHGLDASQPQAYTYSAYGSRHPALDPLHLPGFNRERADPLTGHYLLGNGYRAFNPVLMRFNSPDSLSPFGEGGLSAYGYCAGDPLNWIDPSGHIMGVAGWIKQKNMMALNRVSPRPLIVSSGADGPLLKSILKKVATPSDQVKIKHRGIMQHGNAWKGAVDDAQDLSDPRDKAHYRRQALKNQRLYKASREILRKDHPVRVEKLQGVNARWLKIPDPPENPMRVNWGAEYRYHKTPPIDRPPLGVDAKHSASVASLQVMNTSYPTGIARHHSPPYLVMEIRRI